MIRLLLFILTLMVSVVAGSNVTLSKMDMENRINERVREIVSKVDQSAIVRVKIDLKSIETTLPFLGIEAEVTPLEDGESLGFTSIEKIDVLVLTQSKEIPNWMRREIRQAVAIEGVDVRLNVRKAAGKIEPPKEQMVGAFEKFVDDAWAKTLAPLEQLKELSNLKDVKLGFWGLIGVLALCLSLIGFGIFNMSKKIDSTIQKALDDKLIPALSNIKISQTGSSRSDRSDSASPAAAAAAAAVSPGQGSEFEDFTLDSLLGLLTDCYWTEADSYANYIWSNLKPTQREQIVKSNFIDENYFSYLRQVGKEDFGYHNDAWYLDLNSKFDQVDQETLVEWLRKNPKKAAALSPMRLDFLELNLEERLKFNQTDEKQVDFESIQVSEKSEKRKLPVQLRIRRLSLEDEEFLFTNPQDISPQARTQMTTLVWLALCPLEDRQRIISELDARQIAEAWAGPEEVLKLLREAISDKKFEMVEHFQKETLADRGSEAFGYLADIGLDKYNELQEEKEEAA